MKLKIYNWYVLFIFFFTSFISKSQVIIKVDSIFCSIKEERLPFDVPFLIEIPEKCLIKGFGIKSISDIDIHSIAFVKYNKNGLNPDTPPLTKNFRIIQNEKSQKSFLIKSEPLEPNKQYDILVVSSPMDLIKIEEIFQEIYNGSNDSKISQLIWGLSMSRRSRGDYNTFFENDGKSPKLKVFQDFYNCQNLEKLFGETDYKTIRRKIKEEDRFQSTITLSSNTIFTNLITDKDFIVKADIGYVAYGLNKDINGITPYAGFQYEIQPYNSNVLFSLKKAIENKKYWRILSINAGLSLASVNKANRRIDLVGSKSLMLGGGIRLTNALRLTGGYLLFYREDRNPLIDDRKLSKTPYVGISIDGSLKAVLSDLGTIIPAVRK